MAEHEDKRRTKSESAERKRKEATKGDDNMTDTEGLDTVNFVVDQIEWAKLMARTEILEAERLSETSKRRDLEDDLDREKARVTEIRQSAFNQNTAITSMMKVLTSEGEHKDMVRIMVIKKGLRVCDRSMEPGCNSRHRCAKIHIVFRSQMLDHCG
jgi:hypothetical protein